MNIKIETKVSAPFDKVKKAFVDREGKLLKYLLPLGAKILHYKGVRRGAILKINLPFSGKLKFKIVTYKVTKLYLYFNDIIQEGKIFGAGFWSHRHAIKKRKNHVIIEDDITFTTKNKLKDKLLYVFLLPVFLMRKIKYKLYFWR